jgi:D-3-phosphoglycerate dehydrogenase
MIKLLCPNKNQFSNEIKNLLPKHINFELKELSQKQFNKIFFKYEIIMMRFGLFLPYKKKSKIKYIISPTTGTNHIDKKYFSKNKIKIITLKNEFKFLKNIRATIELTILLILLSLRNYYLIGKKNHILTKEIYQKKIGIIGYGRIGKAVNKYLSNFGAKIFINDKIKNIVPKANFKNLKYIFQNCDIVTFHIPLDKKTYNIFNKKKLSYIKKNAIIINTSRGEIFNEDHLISAMNSKNIRYYTDVVSNENHLNINKFNKFKKTNQFFYSFHKGGMTEESVFKTDKFIIQKFLKYYEK